MTGLLTDRLREHATEEEITALCDAMDATVEAVTGLWWFVSLRTAAGEDTIRETRILDRLRSVLQPYTVVAAGLTDAEIVEAILRTTRPVASDRFA